MSMISEQVKELREIAENFHEWEYNRFYDVISEAADTIESLSAKLQAANMERNGNKILKEIREKAQELSNQHWGDDERHLIGKGIQCMCVQAENIIEANMERPAEGCGGWISCKERLPDESGYYLCTIFCDDGRVLVKTIYFNHLHIWIEDCTDVIYPDAWMPVPEPYHEP